jgi:hypothetical protein
VHALLAAAFLAAAAQAPLLALPAELTESSGVASSSVSDQWFFTHEDSGAEPVFHAVGVDGRLLATYDLGVDARDWEDMARGPGGELWLADIGDNDARRDRGLLVHRVAEPQVDPAQTGVEQDVATTSYRLRYADGPRDAETLLVHPRTGRLFVVTKPLGADPRVYAAPADLDAGGPNVLRRVGTVEVGETGTAGGPGIGSLAQGLVTGGDISPDGTRVALRTYTDLYEWPLPDEDVAAAMQSEPEVTALPPTVQGEGVAYTRDGASLLLTSEGQGAPVHRVPSSLRAAQDGTVEPVQDAGTPRTWLLAGAAALLLALVGLVRRSRSGAGR